MDVDLVPRAIRALELSRIATGSPHRIGRSALIIFVLLALCGAGATLAKSEDLVKRNDGEPIAELGKRLLPSRTKFAHPPVEVEFGPSAHAIVLLAQPDEDPSSNFSGWVLVPTDESLASYRRYSLPPMNEEDGLFEIDVKSVLAATLPGVKNRALVVLYRYHTPRPGGDVDGYSSYVYEWSGQGLAIDGTASDSVNGLKTAAAIRQRLLAAAPAKATSTGEDALLRSVVDDLKRDTGVPILLPDKLPTLAAKPYPSAEGHHDGYRITLGAAPDCGVNACFIGMFDAKRGGALALRERLHLSSGVEARFQAVSCGGSCAPATIEWRLKDVLYTIQLRLTDVDAKNAKTILARLADEAIAAGPR